MSREQEIETLLDAEPPQTLFYEHQQFEEAERALKQQWTYGNKQEYDNRLTHLNSEITDLTGLTSPEDLSIARELISQSYDNYRYDETTNNQEFFDSD